MTLRATGELAALQGEGGALPDKLFHNESKLLDTNTGDRDRSIGKIDPDGPCHKPLDDIKAQDHADHLFPGREAAGAAAVQAKSGDWIWRLDLVHGGTGDEGPKRLFGILVHQSQAERSDPANYFHHVHNSTELASEFGDDAASQDGGAPDLISSDDESEELGAAGPSGG